MIVSEKVSKTKIVTVRDRTVTERKTNRNSDIKKESYEECD